MSSTSGLGSVALALTVAAFAPAEASVARVGLQDPTVEPFKGVTTNGAVLPGLFPIVATGVSTAPVKQAADQFLAALTPDQRARTSFPVDDPEWRLWNNVHRYTRQGTSFKEMTDAQRDVAFGLLRTALSARGFETSRNIMRLNGYLAELLDRPEEYGEYLYWLTVMGQPSDIAPWGWQLDGHHLVINYFVLGDQVVMTPTFMGSEPVSASTGRYAGTTVLQEEQNAGLRLMQSLSDEQRRAAVLPGDKARSNAQAQAFRDNLVVDVAGIRATDLTTSQKGRLLELIGVYVGNMTEGHARVRMQEIERHLDETYFAWVGDTGADAVFYYRIQSPVILIEFDHQGPIALPGPRVPGRQHIHTVVRTPNGNDYGKDLLHQHYEAHKNDPAHGHVREPGR